ncbi:MAG TPA: C1 family peptidase [Chitinophagaceae bacterium]|nr:C1 family peptidase [Chitinophagaceae bacterium]
MNKPILTFFLSCIFFYNAFAQKLNRIDLGLIPPRQTNCTNVKDQFISSTCWSFSSNSFLESELMKMGRGNFDLSEMFIARYSMLRKIRRHLQLKGQNFFTPGGQFHDVMWVIKNYGIVPESTYPGKGRGENSHNHSEMDTVLSRYVKDMVSKGVVNMNAEQEHFIDSVLDHYLGPVPKEFSYKARTYTPKTFLEQVLKFNPDDYIEITSYTHHPFYGSFVLEDKYNWTGDAYYNVTITDFSRITDSALKNGYTVGWDGDAQDAYFDFTEGLAYMPDAINDFQAARQKAFEDQTTLLDHMMHIVGVVKDIKGQKWYYIKNSWGDYSNSLGGFLFMRDDYFKIRTVAIIVNKKAIPADINKKLYQ